MPKKIFALFFIFTLLNLFIEPVYAQYVDSDYTPSEIRIITISNEEPFLLDVDVVENNKNYLVLSFNYAIRPNTNGTYLDKLKQPTIVKFADLIGNLDVREINVDGNDVTSLFTLESSNYTRNLAGNNFKTWSSHTGYVRLDKSSEELGLLISFGTGSTSVYVTIYEGDTWKIYCNNTYTHDMEIDLDSGSSDGKGGSFISMFLGATNTNDTLSEQDWLRGTGNFIFHPTASANVKCYLKEDGPIRARIMCKNTGTYTMERDSYCYFQEDHFFCNSNITHLSSGEKYHFWEVGSSTNFCGNGVANKRIDSANGEQTWNQGADNVVATFIDKKYYVGYKRDDCDMLYYSLTLASTCQKCWWYQNINYVCRDNSNNVYLEEETWQRHGTIATTGGVAAATWIQNENTRASANITVSNTTGSISYQFADQIRLNVASNDWNGTVDMDYPLGYMEIGNFTTSSGIYIYNQTTGYPTDPDDLWFAVYNSGGDWKIKEAGNSGCSADEIIGAACNITQIEDSDGNELNNWYLVFQMNFSATQYLYVSDTVLNAPPIMGEEFQCYNSTDWIQCNATLYNNTITKVKAQCTDVNANIESVEFTLKELYDSVTDFSYEDATDIGGDWWEFDNIDLRINNSGDFEIFANCTDTIDATSSSQIIWTIPWGHLEVVDFSLNETSIAVNETFLANTTIKCVGGECGDIEAYLDPQEVIEEESTKKIGGAEIEVEKKEKEKSIDISLYISIILACITMFNLYILHKRKKKSKE